MDLFVLAADKNMEYALRGGLERFQAMGIRPIEFTIRVHSGRDGGARATGADILALEREQYDAFLLVLDFEGCGAEENTCLQLEARLDAELMQKVGPRAKAIVVEPECDVWVWGSDNAIADALAWGEQDGIRPWLVLHGFELDDRQKPVRPKEALEKVLRVAKKPRSSALYKRLTSQISLTRCSDPAFYRLKQALSGWFPVAGP